MWRRLSKLAVLAATDADRGFCESLSRSNMAGYHAKRGVAWDPERFDRSWREFENLLILERGERVGLLRLLAVEDALDIRDLQLMPGHTGKGIGTWAIGQARQMAARRGLVHLRLRVLEENPAMRLYTRLGFEVTGTSGGKAHMSLAVPRR